MRANTQKTRRMEWARLLGRAATIIEAVTKTTKGMAMEKCTGKIRAIIRVSGPMESSMGLDEWNFPMAE